MLTNPWISWENDCNGKCWVLQRFWWNMRDLWWQQKWHASDSAAKTGGATLSHVHHYTWRRRGSICSAHIFHTRNRGYCSCMFLFGLSKQIIIRYYISQHKSYIWSTTHAYSCDSNIFELHGSTPLEYPAVCSTSRSTAPSVFPAWIRASAVQLSVFNKP